MCANSQSHLYAITQDNNRALWRALAMIRDAIEELGPVGVMRSSEVVACLDGPTPEMEAEEIIRGIQRIVG